MINNLGIIGDILQTVSILMGVFLFLAGMMKLKRYGEMRTMMSHHMTLSEPFLMIVAAAMLLTLPSMIATVIFTFWGHANVMRYTNNASDYSSCLHIIIDVVRVIGVGSFIRGILLLSRTGRVGRQPGLLGKASIHIIGGTCCVNIVAATHLALSIFLLA